MQHSKYLTEDFKKAISNILEEIMKLPYPKNIQEVDNIKDVIIDGLDKMKDLIFEIHLTEKLKK